jgi:peptide deformylase
VPVRGQGILGQPVEVLGEGFLARILQHETDHLDGVIFIDRAQEAARV